MSATVRAAITRGAAFALFWWVLAGGGIAVGAIAVAVSTGIGLVLLPPGRHRPSVFGILAFAIFFGRNSFAGGLDVARRALSRRPTTVTREAYITYRASVEPGPRRALLIGTLGLLPGTVVVEIRGPVLLIHVLDRGLVDPALIASLERHVAATVRSPAS